MNKAERFQRYFIVTLFTISAFFGGWYFGKRGYIYEIRKNPPEIKITNRYPNDQTIDFSLFWRVWDMVAAEYLERPVDGREMLYGAIEGMVASLGDPYTSYLPPLVNETVMNAINGTYEGIGAELGLEEGQLIIVAPLDGSPAKKAGAQSGDRIVKIEELSTVGITIAEAVSQIRGEAGTVSTLTLQRETEEPFVIRIKRGKITVDSVTWEDKGDGVAYMRVSRFGADTNAEWDRVAAEVNVGMENMDVLVLDVRGNPGGYMQSAIHMAGEFFRNEVVVYQESATGSLSTFDTTRMGTFDGVPVYVLIDGGSASASEILAAALKANSDAVLIGTKSFGKGTIQEARDFEDGSGVHLTVAKWLTPEKVWVHKEGITPDVIVERTSEERENGIDSQLNRAIELAKQGIVSASDLKTEKE
jgi:carboxyl-terminal processing protease